MVSIPSPIIRIVSIPSPIISSHKHIFVIPGFVKIYMGVSLNVYVRFTHIWYTLCHICSIYVSRLRIFSNQFPYICILQVCSIYFFVFSHIFLEFPIFFLQQLLWIAGIPHESESSQICDTRWLDSMALRRLWLGWLEGYKYDFLDRCAYMHISYVYSNLQEILNCTACTCIYIYVYSIYIYF